MSSPRPPHTQPPPPILVLSPELILVTASWYLSRWLLNEAVYALTRSIFHFILFISICILNDVLFLLFHKLAFHFTGELEDYLCKYMCIYLILLNCSISSHGVDYWILFNRKISHCWTVGVCLFLILDYRQQSCKNTQPWVAFSRYMGQGFLEVNSQKYNSWLKAIHIPNFI